MKNVFKLFGIIALVAIIGFSMAACGDDDGDGGGGDWKWYTWNDTPDGGTSTIAMTQGSGNDSNKWTFSGNVQKIQGKTYGYAGWGTEPNSAILAAFKSAESFSFKCKGDGKKYWTQVKTSDVTDYNYHLKIFQTSTTEQTITINYSDLAQDPTWGVQKPFDKNKIIAIEFHARAEDNITNTGLFSVTIWDLKANGGSSSGGGGKGKLTVTGIPSRYNGDFAIAHCAVDESGKTISLYGGAKIEDIKDDGPLYHTYYTPVKISDGKVEIPLYTEASKKINDYKAYDGNGVVEPTDFVHVYIMNNGNPIKLGPEGGETIAMKSFWSKTFVNGSLTVQWEDR